MIRYPARATLQVHQEAFSRWRKLVSNVPDEAIGPVAVECQSWCNDNALYHRVLVEGGRVTGGGLESIAENMRVVLTLGDIIMRAVALPSLTEQEANAVAPRKSQK
jgi:hypothetical protein